MADASSRDLVTDFSVTTQEECSIYRLQLFGQMDKISKKAIRRSLQIPDIIDVN